MSPKIVNKEEKRAEIARTAMTLFARKGFENTAVREITQAAGMGKGTFYDYFHDKEEILDEIARIIFDGWRDWFAAEIEVADGPLEKLRTLVRLGVTSVSQFEQMTILYIDLWRLGVGGRTKPGFMGRFKTFLTDAENLAVVLIEQGQTRGLFRPDLDVRPLAAALIAYIDGVALHKLVQGPDLDLDRLWPAFFETLVRGMK